MKFSLQISSDNKAKNAPSKDQNTGKKGRLSAQVNKAQPERVAMELGILRARADEAKDPYCPSWNELYKMYENSETDPESMAQRRIAENKLIAEPFQIIDASGNENDELKLLFQKPWFDSLRKAFIAKELFGYRLVEFGDFDEDNQFMSCKLFPLLNVYPFNKNIIINETDTAGIPYSNYNKDNGPLINPANYFLIEMGDPEDIGLLFPLTREVIIKSFSRQDWAEHSEKWGQPRIVAMTDAEGTDLDNIENGVRNFGRNGYALLGTDDKIEKFEASNNGSGYLIYDKAADKCDKYIAKIINGQYGTGDEQSFVGSAQVSERILTEFEFGRLNEFQNFVNYELIDFLQYWGYPLENAKFHFPRVETYKLQKLQTNMSTNPGTDPEIDTKKQDDPEEQEKTTNNSKAAGKVQIVAKNNNSSLIDKIWNDEQNKTIDPEAWLNIFKSYLVNLRRGFQITPSKADKESSKYKLFLDLQADTARFAAFRQYRIEEELKQAKKGVKKKSEFEILAKNIFSIYSDYQKTEEKAIFDNGVSADFWAGVEENADLYPNIERRTAGDSDVRPSHEKLDGLVLPWDDPFWRTNSAPMDYGCRCDDVQTDKPVNRLKAADNFKAGKGFDFNPYFDKKIMSDNAAYYVGMSDKEFDEVEKESQNLLKNYLDE